MLRTDRVLSHCLVLACAISSCAVRAQQNSTFQNPIFPGFWPDPSCIFVPEWDNTFFCASSSFNAFPGIPLHASKDLRNWKLIGHVLNRPEQLPRLAETNRSTSGIWAPALRKHGNTFFVTTTLVDDHKAANDSSRWDNIIFKAEDPYDPESWGIAIHFDFEGYDPEPFFDDDGKTYIIASHAYRISPGLWLAEANLDTGEVGDWEVLWAGMGGLAPEGPHVYKKDGWYYLLIAEGGTGLGHAVTMARSQTVHGPYEPYPDPVLTNANTTQYFQTVGHADLFQDPSGNWWAVALSTRSGPEWLNFPMGRETVLTAVTWENDSFPVFSPVRGQMSGWQFPPESTDIGGTGPFIDDEDEIDFEAGSSLPAHFVYWRFPIPESYVVSPSERPNTLRLNPSRLNLTALNGNYAGPEGQTFVGRRQQDTLFTFSVNIDFDPTAVDQEAGVSVFLTQNHHLDIGIVMLPYSASTQPFPGQNATVPSDPSQLVPQIRFRGESYVPVPDPIIAPVPEAWVGETLTLEIKAHNMTHYAMSAGPAGARSRLQNILDVSNVPVSWGFTGVILGAYCTTNGHDGGTPAYISNWRYTSQGQYRD
jgi:beta-xylosidase